MLSLNDTCVYECFSVDSDDGFGDSCYLVPKSIACNIKVKNILTRSEKESTFVRDTIIFVKDESVKLKDKFNGKTAIEVIHHKDVNKKYLFSEVRTS